MKSSNTANPGRIIGLMAAGLWLASAAATAAEPNADMRDGAALIAKMVAAAEKRDLKNYCTSLQSHPSYMVFLSNACQNAVKNKQAAPEACTDENLKASAKRDNDRCLAMTPEQFEKNIAQVQQIRSAFVTELKAKDIDGEKLLQEEAAKLR